MISQIDDIIAAVKERVADNFRDLRDYQLHVHCYGMIVVSGSLEPLFEPAVELVFVMEAVAASQ